MKLEDILGEIRKGRRFKAEISYDWVDAYGATGRQIRVEDLLRSDWELEPEKPKTVTITREDLVAAISRNVTLKQLGCHHVDVDAICERLGL